MPRLESASLDNQILTSYGQNKETREEGAAVVKYEHREDDCPNLEKMKKLKAEIKRLRQEVILKPKDNSETDDLEEGFTDS